MVGGRGWGHSMSLVQVPSSFILYYICNTNYACGACLLSRATFSSKVRRNGRTLYFSV